MSTLDLLMSIFSDSRRDQLDRKVAVALSQAYAPATMRTRLSQARRYLQFCTETASDPLPATVDTVCRYVVYLSENLAYSSIVCYLDGLRWLHVYFGLQPCLDATKVRLTLRGVKRQLGCGVHQKLPITPDILRKLCHVLDFSQVRDKCLWAMFLVAFFSFFRKSNLVPPSRSTFDPTRHLQRKDFCFYDWGLVIRVTWSKVIQFRNRVLLIPLSRIPGHVLCPVSAVLDYFAACPAPPESPAFVIPGGRNTLVTLTYPVFTSFLRHYLSRAGYEPSEFSSHSFRRGGASFCSAINTAPELIQLQGDWSSMAYLTYLARPLSQRYQLAAAMATAVSARGSSV